ncbi:hypothetical protein CAEBREN_23790 [Caenorhabditis brenneri]|uniref:Uncharacterized protein n=1 Tax=Caenorhabditis brenneri TaxID=135651 RepID=G0MQD0_CAEBE|nr:hypothetical protein CAEBREN_23790 [Caenorhabditis brenneri]
MMKEIVLITILLVTIYAQTLSPHLEEKRKNLTVSKKMFQLPAGDQALLDEMNTVRQYIAQGKFNSFFGIVLDLAYNLVDITFGIITDAGREAVKEISKALPIKELYDVTKMAFEWGNAGSKLVVKLNVLNDVGGWFGGKRKRRGVGDYLRKAVDFVDEAISSLKKPENVFGPATNMNILTWNRRLAQFAMVKKKEIFDKRITEIEYDGKLYRVTKYGTLATYLIRHALGEKIVQMFKQVRIGYLACQMWFGIDFPNYSEGKTIDETYEILFADRTEVGCYFTWPETFCLIGPLKTRVGYLYEEGRTCSKCKYGNASVGLCDPPPSYFYALRDKYLKHLRPKIEKFEVVEGFDGKPPPIGHNFMIDSSNYTNLLVIHAALIFLYYFIL